MPAAAWTAASTLVLLACGTFFLSAAMSARAQGTHQDHGHGMGPVATADHTGHMAAPADPHAGHHHAVTEGYRTSRHVYAVPDVTLIDADGKQVPLRTVLPDGKPVMLNFVFTTCTTICPVLSATFSQVETDMGDESPQVQLVSISIDPRYDTPAVLKQYEARLGAGPHWSFLTGDLRDIITVQTAFDAYRGDKMNHLPLTFVRGTAGNDWLRLEGFPSADDVVREYRRLATYAHH